jgi:TRAP-type mannitol/chloroaromatic compound transport system permease small subunit
MPADQSSGVAHGARTTTASDAPIAESRALGAVRSVASAATWITGGALVICSVLVAAEVTLRKLVNFSFGGVDEITAYVFAIGVSWSFAFALIQRSNIRVDVVYTLLGRRTRTALDFLSLLVLLGLLILLFQKAAVTLLTTIEINARSNTPLGVPLWIPQSLWLVGLGFTIVAGCVVLFESFKLQRQGAHHALAQLIAVRNTEDDIRDET